MGYWPVVNRVLDECDVIVIVKDSRVPDLSKNEELESKIKKSRKEVIEVFNKVDLISKTERGILEKMFPHAIYIAATRKKGINPLKNKLLELSNKTSNELRVGVVGYPNMGKSAMINALAGQHKAKVSSVAGTTKGTQWIRVDKNILIIDTPGVIPFHQKEDELVLLAAKNPEKVKDVEHAAYVIVRYLLRNRPDSLKRYSNEKELPRDPQEALDIIGKKRGYMMKGGIVDINRTSTQMIRDWQSGKLR
ncbi:MAG TPA: GTPase [Candidatus Nanoarchaeia archaeon]|nr:GTPase [Candidatus Nanoarchaeia archaeon]